MTDLSLPFFGPLAWIDAILLVWFVLTALSLIYVAWDAVTNNPEMTVMKWGWILVTLYLESICLFLYIMSCKEPAPGIHEEFIHPLWKQALGSGIHCVAGDATGIIVAATITALLGLPMWIDLIVEYVGGFAFGLLIFQSLFMRDMMGGSYRKAVGRSLYPEWVSMNFMMAGMFPTMALLMMGRDVCRGRCGDADVLSGERVDGQQGTQARDGHGAGARKRRTQRESRTRSLGTKRRCDTELDHVGYGGHRRGMNISMPGPGSGAHAGMDHGTRMALPPAMRATTTQRIAWAILSVLMLVAGILVPATTTNLRVSARNAGGAVMPPGMIMLRDTPAEAMRDMAAVDPRTVSYTAPPTAHGDQTL
jgi:hypothetical protein